MTTDPHPNEALLTAFRILVAATIVLYLALVGITLWSRHTATANSKALCALRSDIQSHVDGSIAFLAAHPQGIPGIRPSLILGNVRNEKSTLHALRFLSC